MLVDVTALLFTSGTLGSVAEAFGVHENNYSASSAATPGHRVNAPLLGSIAAPSVSPAEVPSYLLAASPGTAASSAELSALTGTSFLRQLSLLPQTNIAAFVSAHPEAISAILAAPPAATEVSGWWTGLQEAERQSMATAAPQLVGNLDGIPSVVRGAANATWLQQSIQSLKDQIASASGRAVTESSERQVHMLDEIGGTLAKNTDGPPRSLLSIDSTGQGRAAVVLGNLDTADYVTYLIPGMFFTVDGQINDWTDDAADLYAEQVEWVNRLAETDSAMRDKTVAVVSWMGYETPNLTNIGSLDLAVKGRDEIARAIEGLQAARESSEPRITIVAHSYGSTAALMALTDYSFEIDGLAVIGSPGSAAQSVDDLHVRNKNVYVGKAAWDPVPNSSFFGSDPGSASYGAKTLYVGGGVDPITGKELAASIGHNGYFGAPDLEATRNLALLGIGHSELITDGTEDASKTLMALKD